MPAWSCRFSPQVRWRSSGHASSVPCQLVAASAGHFFAERDGSATVANRSRDTREQIKSLLSTLEVESMVEREYEGWTALGAPKHWHIVQFAARKRGCFGGCNRTRIIAD